LLFLSIPIFWSLKKMWLYFCFLSPHRPHLVYKYHRPFPLGEICIGDDWRKQPAVWPKNDPRSRKKTFRLIFIHPLF
jgi:hypothetical protein